MNSTNQYFCNSNTSNVTALNENQTSNLVAQWTVLPIASLAVLLAALVGNSLLLFVVIRDRALQTPFNVYLMNLLIAKLVCILIQYPMDLVTGLYSAWFLGNQVCTLYLYINSVVGACTCNFHMLIAINRMWAVCSPISYRGMHSKYTAACLCLGMWVYVHLGVGPPVIIDALYYRLPVESNGCQINTSKQWTWAVLIEGIYWLPQIVMLMTFPITWCAKHSHRRRVMARVMAYDTPMVAVPGSLEIIGFVQVKNDNLAFNGKSPTGKQNGNTTETKSSAAVPATLTGAPTGKLGRNRKGNTYGFLLLALLTVSVYICWTPNNVFYSLKLVYDFDSSVFFVSETILFNLQSVVDPIIFMLALKKLRLGVLRLLHCR